MWVIYLEVSTRVCTCELLVTFGRPVGRSDEAVFRCGPLQIYTLNVTTTVKWCNCHYWYHLSGRRRHALACSRALGSYQGVIYQLQGRPRSSGARSFPLAVHRSFLYRYLSTVGLGKERPDGYTTRGRIDQSVLLHTTRGPLLKRATDHTRA